MIIESQLKQCVAKNGAERTLQFSIGMFEPDCQEKIARKYIDIFYRLGGLTLGDTSSQYRR